MSLILRLLSCSVLRTQSLVHYTRMLIVQGRGPTHPRQRLLLQQTKCLPLALPHLCILQSPDARLACSSLARSALLGSM